MAWFMGGCLVHAMCSASNAMLEASESLINQPTICRVAMSSTVHRYKKPLMGTYVRQITHPQLAGCRGTEVALYKMGAGLIRPTAVCRTDTFTVGFGLQSKLVHQPAHTVWADAFAFIAQRVHNPWTPITLFVRYKNTLNLGSQSIVCHVPSRYFRSARRVKCTLRQAQHTTQQRNRVMDLLRFHECVHRYSFSFAKKVALYSTGQRNAWFSTSAGV